MRCHISVFYDATVSSVAGAVLSWLWQMRNIDLLYTSPVSYNTGRVAGDSSTLMTSKSSKSSAGAGEFGSRRVHRFGIKVLIACDCTLCDKTVTQTRQREKGGRESHLKLKGRPKYLLFFMDNFLNHNLN